MSIINLAVPLICVFSYSNADMAVQCVRYTAAFTRNAFLTFFPFCALKVENQSFKYYTLHSDLLLLFVIIMATRKGTEIGKRGLFRWVPKHKTVFS
jgi:hypothetical protein